MDLTGKIKGFLLEPSKAFDASKNDTLDDALKYYVILAAIISAIVAATLAFIFTLFGSMVAGLGSMLGVGAGIVSAIVIFILLIIVMVIVLFVSGAIFHVCVLIVGGKKGFTQTIKAMIYSSTPRLLFGWIPIIGLLAEIWSLVLFILGIRQLQELSTGRAIVAVIVPFIVFVILVIVIVVFAFMSYSYGTHPSVMVTPFPTPIPR